MFVLVVRTLPRSQATPTLWLSTAPFFAGYPLVHIVAEWVFYYGFIRPPRR